MALSQVQCLDDNHINLRSNESKPEFFYSEEQRLALEKLLQDGQDAFKDYIKTNNIRCHLSDLELQRILDIVEDFCPGSPDINAELYGERHEEVSLQYWPDRSDRSIPQLDIGWPDRVSYRGVTRVQVYTQPAYEGQAHIKEVVRKMIGQAQKVIAVVMDIFTDIDIFRDLLDASYRRKVPVYIILEATGVKHFMRMCEEAGMHTGHLKNLRVQCIRGAEFFSRSSKRVCGSQSQKFMFIDGDKTVSGSYSFTWSASRLDRNLITVLKGQVVDTFDTLFQDMYVMSNGVCLNKINLSSEPKPEYLSRVEMPTPLPSAIKALKLINPKYTLVSNCAFTNGLVSDKNSNSKNQMEIIELIKDTPTVPPVHPGLLNLEKANMINYVPTWPDPEPPSDVIGFINIRDSNKPMQTHLMRSELFEMSQAIRFKDPPKESLTLVPGGGTILQTSSDLKAQNQPSREPQKYFDQNQNQTSIQGEDFSLLSGKPDAVHVLACNKEYKKEQCVTEKELHPLSLQSKNIHTKKDFSNAISSFAQDKTVSDTKPTLTPLQPQHLKSSILPDKTHVDSCAIPKLHSFKQSRDDKDIIDVSTLDHTDEKPETKQNGWNSAQMSNCDSNISSLSDEYYECFSPVADFTSVEDVFVPEKIPESLQNPIGNGHQEQEVPRLNSSSAQSYSDLGDKLNFFTPKLLKTSCSIVFGFLSAEFKTATTPSKITFTQEIDKDTIKDDSKIGVKDSETSDFSQTLNSCFNFSSTSETYFECSDSLGLKSDTDCMVEKPGSVDNINLNHPLQTPKPILEAELSWHNVKEKDKPNMHFGQKQPEFHQDLEMTPDSQLVTKEFKAVVESEDNTDNTELDWTVHRHQVQDSKVTSEPVVGSEQMSNVLQECKISASQQFLEIQTETASVDGAKKVPKKDLQFEQSPVLACEEPNEGLLQDLQHDSSLYLINEGKPVLLAEKNSKPQLQDIQSEVSQDVVCEEQFLHLTQKTGKLPKQYLQTEDKLKPSEANDFHWLVTDSESMHSVPQDKADVTPVISEKSTVTKSMELQRSEELSNPLTDLDSGSNHTPNLEYKECVNECLKQQNNEVCPAVLERNSKEHNHQEILPEQFENIKLLIIEDSDLQETELNSFDPLRPRTTMSKETKLSKNVPVELKTTNFGKLEENKLGHKVYSRNEKETNPPTAVVEEKQEREHICTNQMKKNLPEAKPKTECLARKTLSRIPIQAGRGITKSLISKLGTSNCSFGHQAPKTTLHGQALGKPLRQNKPNITSSPSPEKVSIGGIRQVRLTQIPQRPTWTVPAPNDPTSAHKQSQVPRVAPRMQPNVTRKQSASMTKYNCSSSGIPCPGQVKKQAFKGHPSNN